jgi:hypothetical protein
MCKLLLSMKLTALDVDLKLCIRVGMDLEAKRKDLAFPNFNFSE